MTQDEVLRRLPELLSPVILEANDDVVAARRAAIEKLYEDEVDPVALVAVAHSQASPAQVEVVNASIRAFDTAYVSSSAATTELLAAVTLLFAFGRVSAYSTTLALLTESAAFIGWQAANAEVASRAVENNLAAARASRQRGELKRQAASRLSTEDFADVVKAVNATSRRMEDVVAVLISRISVMDEELNLLWWARTQYTTSTGEEWDSLGAIDRRIASAIDVFELSTAPASAGALGLMVERGNAPKPGLDECSVLDFATAGKDRLFPRTAENLSLPLLPILTAVRTAVAFEKEPAAVVGVLRVAGINPEQVYPLETLGSQLLRELSIAARIL